jgi:hypothetical protein
MASSRNVLWDRPQDVRLQLPRERVATVAQEQLNAAYELAIAARRSSITLADLR